LARTAKPIDGEVVRRLAAMQCTHEEIAAVVGCSHDTLTRRFRKELDVGPQQGKARLRRVQWRQAMKGNTAMLIWLGKQMLGQSDKTEVGVGKAKDLEPLTYTPATHLADGS
jgi:AraC-like DNA-binding protein